MSNTNNAKNVATGKPKITGAIYWAPEGTDLPTDATTELAEAYQGLGYVSEDGVTNASSLSADNIKAWGGVIVQSAQTEKGETFALTLIESLKEAVLKAIYGVNNVTGTKEQGNLKITVNDEEIAPAVWVIDTILNEGILKRIVIPRGKISALGDIVYNGKVAVGYNPTITALPDTNGNTHYEYFGNETVISA